MDLLIRYGPAATDEDEALALARRLFAHFDDAIDSLTLVPTHDDELSLSLNGRLVHSRAESGRPPRLADVLALTNGADLSG